MEILQKRDNSFHPLRHSMRLITRKGNMCGGARLRLQNKGEWLRQDSKTVQQHWILNLSIEEIAMRSNLIYGALTHVENRYQLCQLASKATRKLHKPNTRLQDTMNDVLLHFRTENPSGKPVRQTEIVRKEERRAA